MADRQREAQAAMEACLRVLRGEAPPTIARRAFVAAALEARPDRRLSCRNKPEHSIVRRIETGCHGYCPSVIDNVGVHPLG